MNNETEQIFLLTPTETQSSTAAQKLEQASVPPQDVEDFSTVCRTCATVTEFVIPIFAGEGVQNNLADKIHKHLPIQVSETDVLPRVVCYQCANTLLAWHELVQCCVQADEALRTRLAVAAAKADSIRPVETITESKSSLKDIEESSEQEQNKSSSNFCTILKDVLLSHYSIITEDNLDTQIVCLKCTNCPSSSNIEQLAYHLESTHQSEISNYANVKKFIANYITLEETLICENSDRDVESDSNDKCEVLPNLYCPFCQSIFSTMARLLNHLNTHIELTIEDGVICCDNFYESKKTFVKHLQDCHVTRTVDETKHTCRTCGFQTETIQALQDHISQAHYEEREKPKKPERASEKKDRNQKFIPAVCSECNKVFSNKYNMFNHMRSHGDVTVKYACGQCHKIYSSPSNLNNHRKVAHAGILNFVCTTCGEAFHSRVARDVHSRIHTGEKPYPCDRCSKSFRSKNSLDRHIEMHLDIRKYECHLCPKKFRKRTHLNYHVGTHKKHAK
ncbi:zinc finger protein 567-like isoform X1 [Ostrinia furnacalis]|uniref:zinc finger protein 567-like isoform X1 n=1 Tax=Ostrinia furnacalis TaxID=93504 RepID=UPI00103A5CFE|nr:zinc finger protein 567-like isoform X1 [Ostrinia furnacalis]